MPSLRADFSALIALLEGYAVPAPLVGGGVVSVGEAAAYALVWEYGNLRQTKQGPRTVRGVNPNGESVWLSSQAPLGYISIHSDEFIDILVDELSEISLDGDNMDDIADSLRPVAAAASVRMAALISASAPIDHGDLSASIQPMSADDPSLLEMDTEDDEE